MRPKFQALRVRAFCILEPAQMADPALQALLDPDGTGNGIMIQRRVDSGVLSSYYVVPQATLSGHARWVDVTTANTDAQKNTAIRAALA